jgi:glycosyltransferase involved in cell wall biosynthesis
VRIVLVGTAYPLRGGIAHYIALLYRTLEKRGHTVRVLSFRKQYPSFLFPGKTQKDEGNELIRVEAVPLLNSINPLTWVRAVFWLKKERPDLILFQYWMPFFAPCYAVVAFLSRTLLRVPSMYLCHNIIPHETSCVDRLLSRLGLAFVDFFIVQSGAVREDLLRLRPGADYRQVDHPVYEIFPAAISQKEARQKLGLADRRVMLYFGYIRAYKGVPSLIRAMKHIVNELPVRLLVCGEFYDGREEALGLIRELNLEESVTVYDRFIPNQDVALYFCASDLVVLPYLSATQSGIVQVAYHYDRPVIITRVGGLPEVVLDGETGFVVPPDDPEALAESVLRFYREKRFPAFSDRVRQEKKKYSWDRIAEAVEDLMS